ncbi:MAG: helix-turn-helix transcriptional regulator [Polyangiaceae bacterium]|nr:helix-turn-helix transcriptional regulator [Polyangiaceae bacterium]
MSFTFVNVIHIERSRRVADRRTERIDAILEQALDIVQSEGFDALTLQRLAHSLGLVTTALYRYFPSKDALSAALQRRAIADVHAHFQAEQRAALDAWSDAHEATSAVAELLLSASLYLGLPRSKPRAWFFIALLLGDPRPLLSDGEAMKTGPLFLGFLGEVTASFERATRTGALSPGSAQERVLGYWAALHGALCLEKARRLAPVLPAPEGIGMSAARGLLESWGASAPRLVAAERLVAEVVPSVVAKIDSPKKGRAK